MSAERFGFPARCHSPELNRVENLWRFARHNHLSNIVFDRHAAIAEKCRAAGNALIAAPADMR